MAKPATSSPYIFPRGAPIVIDLVVEDPGNIDPSDVIVAMKLKRSAGGQAPTENVPAVAQFDITFTPATGAEKAFWRGVIAASVARQLRLGEYVTDAQLTLNGKVIGVTFPAKILLRPSVTPEPGID